MSAGEERRSAAFDAFLHAWERETVTELGLDAHWTALDAAASPLPPADRTARHVAIEALRPWLFARARRRGSGDLDAKATRPETIRTALRTIGALHEALLAPFVRAGQQRATSRLGLEFLRFAAGVYRRPPELADTHYQNGEPNGALLICLPELADQLAAVSYGSPALWRGLRPALVGCLVVYARTYAPGRRPYLADLGCRHFRPERQPDDAQLQLLRQRLSALDAAGALDAHWRNALALLAPASFAGTPLLADHANIDAYLDGRTVRPS